MKCLATHPTRSLTCIGTIGHPFKHWTFETVVRFGKERVVRICW